MPNLMNLRFDEKKNIVYIKLSGTISIKDIIKAFDRVVADKQYRIGMGRLWDFREVDMDAVQTGDVIKGSHHPQVFPAGISDVKVAIVTNRDLEYGLSRMSALFHWGRPKSRYSEI